MIATFKLKDTPNIPVAQIRQLEYQASIRVEEDLKSASTSSVHETARCTETGIKPVDPAAIISLMMRILIDFSYCYFAKSNNICYNSKRVKIIDLVT